MGISDTPELVRNIKIIIKTLCALSGVTDLKPMYGLSTATIECICECVCVHDDSKNNGCSLETCIVVYENSSGEFDIGHYLIKVKVTVLH